MHFKQEIFFFILLTLLSCQMYTMPLLQGHVGTLNVNGKTNYRLEEENIYKTHIQLTPRPRMHKEFSNVSIKKFN